MTNLPSLHGTGPAIGRSARAGGPAAACLALVLALGCNQANAVALGDVATSIGFFAALAALLITQALPALQKASSLSNPVAALLLVAGAILLWRARRASFATGLLWFAPRRVPPSPRGAMASAVVLLPVGLGRDELLAELRHQFVRLQAAWDAREVEVLRALTTPDMHGELCAQLPVCGSGPNRTDVMTLHAELLGFDELGAAYLASVEFTGMIRECSEGGAAPFRELWMLVRPKHDGADWRLARQLELP